MPTLVLLATLIGLSVPSDPLGPARAGLLQCHSPDTARKTCAALAGYTFEVDGRILNQAEVMLTPSPLIVMRNVSPVVVRDGAVCGELAGLDNAVFTSGGRPVAPAMASMIRAQVSAAFAQIGKEACTTYTPQGDGLLAQVAVDGVARPELNQPVIWVSPSDGYVVAP